MEDWKRAFADKLKDVQSHWVKQFDVMMDQHITPAFDELEGFVRNVGFTTSSPMREDDRRSLKFELAENAYLLMIFRSTGIGEFELRCESFAPGQEPVFTKQTVRVVEVDNAWAERRFQVALDAFVDHLGSTEVAAEPELVA